MMAGRKVQPAGYNRQSLLTTLNAFVEEVNTMNDKVMVPCRLRDMQFAENTTEYSEDNNNMSVLPASDCKGETLYSYYAMINAVKNEILSGHGHEDTPEKSDSEMESSSDNDSDDGANDAARKTAEAFRHHLQGLFGLLHQLTNTAKVLGNTYEDQVGGTKKLRKFVI